MIDIKVEGGYLVLGDERFLKDDVIAESIGFTTTSEVTKRIINAVEKLRPRVSRVTDDVLMFTIPTRRLLETTTTVLLMIKAGRGGLAFFEPYGTGKTHLLAFINNVLSSRSGAINFIRSRKSRLSGLDHPIADEIKKYLDDIGRLLAELGVVRIKTIRERREDKPLRDVLLGTNLGREYNTRKAAEEVAKRIDVAILDEYQERRVNVLINDPIKRAKEREFLKALAENSVVLLSANPIEDEAFERFMSDVSAALRRPKFGSVEPEDAYFIATFLFRLNGLDTRIDPVSVAYIESNYKNLRDIFTVLYTAVAIYKALTGLPFTIGSLPYELVKKRGPDDDYRKLLIVAAMDESIKGPDEKAAVKYILRILTNKPAVSPEGLEVLEEILKNSRVPSGHIKALFGSRVEKFLSRISTDGILITRRGNGYSIGPILYLIKLAKEEDLKALVSIDARDPRRAFVGDVSALEEVLAERAKDLFKERLPMEIRDLVGVVESPEAADFYNVYLSIDENLYREANARKLIIEKIKASKMVDLSLVVRESVEAALTGLLSKKPSEYIVVHVAPGKSMKLKDYVAEISKVVSAVQKALVETIKNSSGNVVTIEEVLRKVGYPVPENAGALVENLAKKVKIPGVKGLIVDPVNGVINIERESEIERTKKRILSGLSEISRTRRPKPVERVFEDPAHADLLSEEELEGFFVLTRDNKIAPLALIKRYRDLSGDVYDEDSLKDLLKSHVYSILRNVGHAEDPEALKKFLARRIEYEEFVPDKRASEIIDAAINEVIKNYLPKRKKEPKRRLPLLLKDRKVYIIDPDDPNAEEEIARILEKARSIKARIKIEFLCRRIFGIMPIRDFAETFVDFSFVVTAASALLGNPPSLPNKRFARRNDAGVRVAAIYLGSDDPKGLFEGVSPNEGLPKLSKAIPKRSKAFSKAIGLLETFGLKSKEAERYATIALKLLTEPPKSSPKFLVDAFGGSGTFAREALALGHAAAYIDVNPAAAMGFISLVYPPDPDRLDELAEALKNFELGNVKLEDLRKTELGTVKATIHARIIACPDGYDYKEIEKEYEDYTKGKPVKFETHLTPLYYSKKEAEKLEFDRTYYLGYRDGYEFSEKPSGARCKVCGRVIETKHFKKLAALAYAIAEPRHALIEPAFVILEESRGSYLEPGKLDRDNVRLAERILAENRYRIKEYFPDDDLRDIARIIETSTGVSSKLNEFVSYGLHKFTRLFSARQILVRAALLRLLDEDFEDLIPKVAGSFLLMVNYNALVAPRYDTKSFNIRASKLAPSNTFLVPSDSFEINPFSETRNASIVSILKRLKGNEVSYKVAGRQIKYNLSARIITEGVPKPGEVVVVNDSLEKVAEYIPPESADAAFVDPPYYDAVDYAGLSVPAYLLMKKIVGVPELDERIGSDVTSKQPKFLEKLAKALSGLYKVLKPGSPIVLVFAPPKEALKKGFVRARSEVLAALIEAGFIPVIASAAFLEPNASRPKRSIFTIFTSLVLGYKGELEEVLELFGIPEEILEDDESALRAILYSDFTTSILKKLASIARRRLEEVGIPIILSLLGIVAYYRRVRHGREPYKELERLYSSDAVREFLKEYLVDPLEIKLLEAAGEDLSTVYVYALLKGFLNTDFIDFVKPIKVSTPKELYEKPKEKFSGVPIPRGLSDVYKRFKRDRTTIKGYEALSVLMRAAVLGSDLAFEALKSDILRKYNVYKAIKEGLERYADALEGATIDQEELDAVSRVLAVLNSALNEASNF